MAKYKIKIPNCRDCGACCAGGRKWVEVTKDDLVRIGDRSLVEKGDIEPYAMKTKYGRCVALNGVVGMGTTCTIYERRPEICRKVERGSEFCLYSLGLHHINIIE